MSQQEKILRTMIRFDKQEWWRAPDFMAPGLDDLFVGYEASPRMTEVAQEYGAVIETRKNGRFREIKLVATSDRAQRLPISQYNTLYKMIRLERERLA